MVFVYGLIFLLTRLIFLLHLPIFNDESMYLHWAQIYQDYSYLWTYSIITDGKQPLLIIILGHLLRLPVNPLLLGRLLAVLASFLTFVISLKIFKLLFPKKGFFWPFVFFSFCPYLLFFNRQILMEPFVSLAVVASLFLVLKNNWLWGLALGLGWWFKSSSLLFVLPAVLTFLLLRKKGWLKKMLLGAVGGLLIIYPLFSHPLYKIIPMREKERVLSLTEAVWNFDFLSKNFTFSFWWLFVYATPVIFYFAVLQMLKLDKKIMILALWFLLPFLAIVFAAKLLTSRYFVIVLPFYLMFGSAQADSFFKKRKSIFGSALKLFCLIFLLLSSWLAIVAPEAILLHLGKMGWFGADKNQYVTGWASGFGVNQAVNFIKERAANKKTVVFVRHDSGNPEDAVFAFFHKNKNVKVEYVAKDFLENRQKLKQTNTQLLFVSRGNQLAGLDKNLERIVYFFKPENREFIGVFQIK